MIKTLILHAGSAKTGSSALQTAFVRARSELADLGLIYARGETDPLAEAGRPTAGNGAEIARMLCDPYASDQDLKIKLDDRLAALAREHEGQRVLLSSEWFETLSADRIALLIQAAKKVSESVEVLYLVRHVADHALALYSDSVWRKGTTDAFEDFIASYAFPFRAFLDGVAAVVEPSKVRTLVYDDHRSSLVGDVLDLLGTPLPGITQGERVNRSLSRLELEMIRRLYGTSEDTDFVSRLAAEHAYQTRGMAAEDLMITQRELKHLESRTLQDIRHINQTYLRDEEKLNSCSDLLVIGDHREAHGLSPREQMLASMLEAAVVAHQGINDLELPT